MAYLMTIRKGETIKSLKKKWRHWRDGQVRLQLNSSIHNHFYYLFLMSSVRAHTTEEKAEPSAAKKEGGKN